MGTMVLIYSYLRGDLRKEVLDYTYSQKNYKKEATKQMDTWLDAVRNLRNYCAHHSMLVGMTSSVVIPDNRDSSDVLSDNTNLYSRLYAREQPLFFLITTSGNREGKYLLRASHEGHRYSCRKKSGSYFLSSGVWTY